MPNPTYDIFFSGEMIESVDPDIVRQDLERLLKIDSKTLTRLFSGKPVRIKGGVDQETAIRYRTTFREAGALIEIRAVQAVDSLPVKNKEAGGQEEMTLLPPKTGTLIDCAPEIEPADIPDISGITLSPAGSRIDEMEPPPPLTVNTDALSLMPDSELPDE